MFYHIPVLNSIGNKEVFSYYYPILNLYCVIYLVTLENVIVIKSNY